MPHTESEVLSVTCILKGVGSLNQRRHPGPTPGHADKSDWVPCSMGIRAFASALEDSDDQPHLRTTELDVYYVIGWGKWSLGLQGS